MSEYIILFRNPIDGKADYISEENDGCEMAVFESREAAEGLASQHIALRRWPYRIIEVDWSDQ